MRNMLCVIIASLLALAVMAEPPTVHNLGPWAYEIINAGDSSKGIGRVNLLVQGDSITSQTAGGRFCVGIRDAWRPYRWSGWSMSSADIVYNPESATTDPGWTITPAPATRIAGQLETNHYSYANTGVGIGLQYQSQQSGTYDTPTGTPATPNTVNAGNSEALKFAAMDYREVVINADQANATFLFGWVTDFRTWNRFNSVAEPSWTASTYGNWSCKGDAVTARLIYFKNTSAPTSVTWKTYRRNSLNNSTTFNPNGAAAIAYVDTDFNTSATSDNLNAIRGQLHADSLGTNETGTVLPCLFVRFFRPNTPGLEVHNWSQPGWNFITFTDNTYAGMSTTYTPQLLAALGWPTHLLLLHGQNQTTAQTNELNLGTSTTFKANYNTWLNELMAAYIGAGQPLPKVCLLSPYKVGPVKLATDSRNVLNYATMDQAIYEVAAARGYAFVSLLQMTPTGFEMEDNDGSGGASYAASLFMDPDSVHPLRAGSTYFMSGLWNQMLASQIQKRPLRGRGR